MTIFGWDASDFDWARGPMDLAAARRAGIDFFTHKATEGLSVVHEHFAEAMRRARAAGVPVLGAYHVVRSTSSVSSQVTFHLSKVDAMAPWWRDWPGWLWQVDLELWDYDRVPASLGEAYADEIERRTGRRAVIYASRGQYGEQLTGSSHPLWNANYGTNPTTDFRTAYKSRGGDTGPGWTAYSGQTPILWQYGSRTTIGSQTITDANAYRGTVEQLLGFLTGEDPDMSPEESRQLFNLDRYLTAVLLDADVVSGLREFPGDPTPVTYPLHDRKRIKALAADVADLKARPAADAAAVAAALAADAGFRDALADAIVARLPAAPSAGDVAEAVADELHQRTAD